MASSVDSSDAVSCLDSAAGSTQGYASRWLRAPSNQRELDGLRGVIDPAVIGRETAEFIARSRALGDAVFGEFIQLFQGRRRRTVLPSR